MKRTLSVLLALALMLSVTACGQKEPASTPPAQEPVTQQPAPAEPEVKPDGKPEAQDPEQPEDGVVRVASAGELLEAIAPGVKIELESGYYNLSEYLNKVWAAEGTNWNDTHPYVRLEECFDGIEVWVIGVDGLSLSGAGESAADTEVVVDPRYATVLSFENCSDIKVSDLTAGHTELGECSGNVLDFYGCGNVELENLDLYGCGMSGIGCYENTSNVYVSDSVIRDCSDGPLAIYGCAGEFEFRNCQLTGSEGYGWYDESLDSQLSFYNCTFGDNETSYFMFLESVWTEDCIWSDNYIYPDVGPGYEEEIIFNEEALEAIEVDRAFVEGSFWTGYLTVSPESGELAQLPYEDGDGNYVYVSIGLYEDGTGWYDTGYEYGDISWDCEGTDRVWFRNEAGDTYYMVPYADQYRIWMLVDLQDTMVWAYR